MKNLYIAILLVLGTVMVQAQDNTFSFLKGVPQTTQINPAFRPVKGGYFALPGAGSIKLNFSNTGFSWSDVIRKGTGAQVDSFVVDLDNLEGKLKDVNTIFTDASVQIMGFGFYVGQAFVSVDVNHKMKARFNYPKSLLDLRYGNWDYDNELPINHSLSDMYLNMMNYTEFGLGISHPITENIIFGARVKALFGVVNVESERFKIDIETFENGNMLLKTDMAFRTSLPLIVSYDEDGFVDDVEKDDDVDARAMFVNSNMGFGLDLGLTWKATDKLTLGAAINDIGYINWKTRTRQFYSKGEYLYEGVDVSDEFTGDEDKDVDYWDDLADDIKDEFRANDNQETYKTGLMGHFNITADYQAKTWLNLGGITKNYFVDGTWIPSATMAVGLNPGSALSTVFSYSMMKNAPANFGAALALKGGPLQIYLATDHLNSLVSPGKAKYVNARLGINLVF